MKNKWLIIIVMTLDLFGLEAKETVCLNMIVKDESPIIIRCLESVKPLIDRWVIVDTGSSDGTQEIIKEYMKDVPGELHERPWKNFAHNRNEAFQLAKNHSDYLLIIDADEILSYDKGYKFPKLDKDFYYIKTSMEGMEYSRVELINSRLNWQWVGAVHEALQSPQARTHELLTGIINIPRTDGHRSQNPRKYHVDALILEEALKEDPNNTRNIFYLAQSYRDSSQFEKALAAYEMRVSLGGWNEEIFWSLLQIASIKEIMNASYNDVVTAYKKAFAYRPSRVEPLYYLSSYQRRNNQFEEGFKTIHDALTVKKSKDNLFIEKWIYDYGLVLEYSILSYRQGHFVDSLIASNLLLADHSLPENVRICVLSNLAWTQDQIVKMAASSNLITIENSLGSLFSPEANQSMILASVLLKTAKEEMKSGNIEGAYHTLQKAIIVRRKDSPSWSQDYGLLSTYALTAFKTGRGVEAYLASKLLMTVDTLTDQQKSSAQKNLDKITAKLHLEGEKMQRLAAAELYQQKIIEDLLQVEELSDEEFIGQLR